MSEDPSKTLYCSFCGKSQREVKKLVAGPAVFICDECIGLCSEIVAESEVRQARASRSGPTPAEIKSTLDDYVSAPSNVVEIEVR